MGRWARRFIWLLAALALLAGAAWLTFQLPVFGGKPAPALLERMHGSQAWRGTRFENTPPYVSNLSFTGEMKAWMGNEVREPRFEVPVRYLNATHLARPVPPGMRARWLGHATVLLEIDGVRIMTDPVLSKRVSPFQFIGPGRLHPAPIPKEELQNVDAVVISHDHFDHLDMGTAQALARGGTHFYVGLGIGAHLLRWGVPAAQVHDMDWWEQAKVGNVTIHCLPARHYSGRKSMDNSTLWSSWLVKGPNSSAYFSGDTGYAGHFKEVRQKLGAPQLAMLKIGAYGETWKDIHMTPESAVRAHQDLGAAVMLPVHWATFNLAYHSWDEPILRTLAAAKAAGVQVVTPQPGELFDARVPFESKAWYLGPGRG